MIRILKLFLLQGLFIGMIWLFLVNQSRVRRIISLCGVFATATSCRHQRFLDEIRLRIDCHMRPWFIRYTIVPTTSIRVIPWCYGGRKIVLSFHIIRTRWFLFLNKNRGRSLLLPTFAIFSCVAARAIPSFCCEYQFATIYTISKAAGFWGWSCCGRHSSLCTCCLSWLLMKYETWWGRSCIITTTIYSVMLMMFIIQGDLASFQRLHI